MRTASRPRTARGEIRAERRRCATRFRSTGSVSRRTPSRSTWTVACPTYSIRATAGTMAETRRRSDAVPEPLRLRKRLELLERVVLDLADALSCHPEGLADLLERARLRSVESVAQLDHTSLALGEGGQRQFDVLSPQREGRRVERRLRSLVRHEVAERGVLLLADRLLEGDGELRHPQDLAHLLDVDLELLRDLLGQRLAAEPLDELALDVDDLVQLLDHVDRDPDRPRLVGDRAGDRLADPPRRVRRELEPASIVELLDGAYQPQRPLLDEIQEGEAASEVALRDGDDQPKVRLDHVLLRRHVAALDELRERHLLVGRQERDLPDLAQVQAQRVERGLHREIELRLDLLLLGRHGLCVREVLVLDAFVELDRVVDQVGVEVFDLLLRELDVVEPRHDLVVGEEPLLEPLLDQALELLDLGEGDIDGQHGLGFLLSRSNGY